MMLINLPQDAALRRVAYNWLTSEGIKHMRLFQAVQIDDSREAERLKRWLASQG